MEASALHPSAANEEVASSAFGRRRLAATHHEGGPVMQAAAVTQALKRLLSMRVGDLPSDPRRVHFMHLR